MYRFYNSILESVISFGISCWGAAIRIEDKNKIDQLIKKAQRIVNCGLSNFDTIYTKACTRKYESIIKDTDHPLNECFNISNRSKRVLQPAARTERYRKSFVPSSVRLTRQRSMSIWMYFLHFNAYDWQLKFLLESDWIGGLPERLKRPGRWRERERVGERGERKRVNEMIM